MSTPTTEEIQLERISAAVDRGDFTSASDTSFLLGIIEEQASVIKRLTARVTDLRAMRRREGF
jgi:hypothetical protein